jgi:clan AA aspartic protease
MIKAFVKLENLFFPETGMEVEALVDTGASFSVIPSNWADKLFLKKIGQSEAELADGSKKMMDRVAGLAVTFEGRTANATALIGGNEFILGMEAMQQMDVVCSPSHKKLMINPSHPDIPSCIMKGYRCNGGL